MGEVLSDRNYYRLKINNNRLYDSVLAKIQSERLYETQNLSKMVAMLSKERVDLPFLDDYKKSILKTDKDLNQQTYLRSLSNEEFLDLIMQN